MPHSTLPAPRFAPSKPSPLGQSVTLQEAAANLSAAASAGQGPGGGQHKKKSKHKRHGHGHGTTAGPSGGGGGAPVPFIDDSPVRQFATQVHKLVDALKVNGGPMNLSDLEAVTGVRGLLSEHTDYPFNPELLEAFNNHDRVVRLEKGVLQLWSYRPDYNISTPGHVLALLRKHTPAKGGMLVSTLKDSWPGVMSAIEELEKDGKVMVLRTDTAKGTGIAKAVFYDPLGDRQEVTGATGKRGRVQDEFREVWSKIATPPDHALSHELTIAGLTSSTPASVPGAGLGQSYKKQKKNNRGRGGKVKITNTHSTTLGVDLTKDYVPGGDEAAGKGRGKAKKP